MKKLLLSLAGVALTASAYADTTVYFEENFEWLAPWALEGNGSPAGDTVGTDDPGANAPQLATPKLDEVSAYDALLAKGYVILGTHAENKGARNPEAQTYLQTNYLKFGLTGYYSGITMPITEEIPADEAITISFDWCSQRQSSGKWDSTELVVIVTTDGNEVSYPVAAWNLANGAAYEWVNQKIDVKAGVLKNGSTITIRNADSQWPSEAGSALRWFVDNIKVYSETVSGGEENPGDDEPLVGDVVFEEDFEWLAPWALEGNGSPAGDTVGTDDPGANAPQLGTPKVDEITAYDALLARGYVILGTHAEKKSARQPQAQTYLQSNYLKFGLTGYYSGIVMPITNAVPQDEVLTLSFDWCSQRQSSGVWDPTEIVVVVTTNGNEVAYPVPVWNFANDATYAWVNQKIELEAGSLKKGSTVTIRNADSQWPDEGGRALRWFLDNVKISRNASSAVNAVEFDEDAPVEYYNLQGVRVSEPANGIYIVKQGNKVEKRVIR